MRIWWGAALAVVSGAMVAAAWPEHSHGLGLDLGWLVLVAGVPMLVAQHHVLPARWAGLATGLTYGIGAAGLATIVDPSGPAGPATIWGAVVAEAVAAGIVGHVERQLWTRIGYRWWIVAAPLAWGLQALVRLRLPFAGADGFLGLDLFRHPTVLQPVSVVGAVGLEMAIVLVNVALAALVLGALGHDGFPRPRVRRLAVGLTAGLAVWLAWSLVLLDDPPDTVRVAAVQPASDGNWFAYSPGTAVSSPVADRLAAQTEQAAAAGAQLVVWPEYALINDPCAPDALIFESSDPSADTPETPEQWTVPELARRTGTYLVVGYDVVGVVGDDGDEPSARNEAVLITPEGECRGPYAKQHPVEWIGERSDSDHGAPTFATDLGRLAMAICYDLDFTDVSRAVAADGAQLIAAPSEDWSAMARYHVAPLVFRSIENGVATVKADQRYDSAVIDPHGRIVDEVVDPGGRSALLVADVPLGTGRRTFWNRHATHLELLWLVAALAVAALV
ncbi:MAG TPA: nitrilase-related carbon-nitrogen hydrolase, partial [Acidimicrobiales bacterium]|nr:nitrilase-related carbon-nitrogen hydrolase [Acidimicrobiales bacterium]